MPASDELRYVVDMIKFITQKKPFKAKIGTIQTKTLGTIVIYEIDFNRLGRFLEFFAGMPSALWGFIPDSNQSLLFRRNKANRGEIKIFVPVFSLRGIITFAKKIELLDESGDLVPHS